MTEPLDPKQHDEPTSITYAGAGDLHAVLISDLRVVVTQDEGLWFAQGLELDYAASGTSEEDVKTRFAQGLGATINETIKVYGSIEQIVKVAPQEAWDLWLQGDRRYVLGHLTLHDLQAEAPAAAGLPFSGIAFLGKQMLGMGTEAA